MIAVDKGSFVEGEAPAAKRRRGKKVKVKGVFHATAARHRMAWGTEKGPQTEKEKQAAKRMLAERRAAEDQIAAMTQELERDFGVSSPARDSRLQQRLTVDASGAKGKHRFRQAVDASRGTRVLGYYDGTAWLLVRDEEERREFFYNSGSREATWDEPPELQAENHTGSTDDERTSAAQRAITSITRSMRGRTKRRRQILAAYAKCVKRLSGGYPDYVNRRLCYVEDIITALMLGLVAALCYMRSAGIANIWVGAGVQTSRERHGENWHGGSEAIKGSAGIPIDLILLIVVSASKVLLCLGPQDGAAQAVAQMCCTIEFEPLPGHARQLQQLVQASVFCVLTVFSIGLPFFCFVWTFSSSLWLILAGFMRFDPIWIAAGYAADKEVAWLTPPPRFCKPMAKNLASVQYGFGGATLVWAATDGRGVLRPPTRTSIRCACLHRHAREKAELYAHGGMPMPGLGDSESDSDVEADGEDGRDTGDAVAARAAQDAGDAREEQLEDVGGDEEVGATGDGETGDDNEDVRVRGTAGKGEGEGDGGAHEDPVDTVDADVTRTLPGSIVESAVDGSPAQPI